MPDSATGLAHMVTPSKDVAESLCRFVFGERDEVCTTCLFPSPPPPSSKERRCGFQACCNDIVLTPHVPCSTCSMIIFTDPAFCPCANSFYAILQALLDALCSWDSTTETAWAFLRRVHPLPAPASSASAQACSDPAATGREVTDAAPSPAPAQEGRPLASRWPCARGSATSTPSTQGSRRSIWEGETSPRHLGSWDCGHVK